MNIEFLLYNPENNEFQKDFKNKITQLVLTEQADLNNNNNFLFNDNNFSYKPNQLNFNNEMNYFKYLNIFTEKFRTIFDNIKMNLEEILAEIKNILKVKDLYYETTLKIYAENHISYPKYGRIFLY